MKRSVAGSKSIPAILLIVTLPALVGALLALDQPASAQTDNAVVSLSAAKDNTLYEDLTGSTSNGAGSYFFVGSTANGDIRRGVIAFDIASAIPAGSTINSVTLTLHMSRTVAGAENITLHRLLADWGEGASNAAGEEGDGAQATTGDATWLHTFYDTGFWTTSGGDFVGTASASASVGGVAFYSWGSTPRMVADVQAWLDNPASNFGWLVKGNEAMPTTAKRFDSRQNREPATSSLLIMDDALNFVVYIPLVRNGTCRLCPALVIDYAAP